MLIYIILFAPLFGSLWASLFAFSKKNLLAAVVPVLMLCISLVAAFYALFNAANAEPVPLYASLFSWITAGWLDVSFGFMIDRINLVMILVVLVVSLLVHIYSIGYMSVDRCFNKFFAFLSAFVFSMLFLVMSDNFLGLFVGWEGVGLCSWMLIGFWYERRSASFAANEAFIMNRVADLGMLLGIFAIFYTFGSLRYSEVLSSVNEASEFSLTLIGILLFIGAMGKSAQFPLHTWLADAMEGPTPVSALIHAATMVTAGVYLVVRTSPIYDFLPSVSLFITYLGAFVAIFAASMALVNKDLKRIIAYSTLSQLGYMFVAAGLGYYYIALFHLAMHAFFKSLLFLGAGNVMHAMDDKLDITKMGALFKPLKYTAILMTIASIALAGIYPFAGFFSKDKILEIAYLDGGYFLWIVLLLTALLTAFYSFRLLMLVFFVPKNHESHPHEASKIMLLSMLPLGILAIVAGFMEHSFNAFLNGIFIDMSQMYQYKEIHADSTTLSLLITVALTCAISGIVLAIVIYKKGLKLIREDSFVYKLLFNQYYIPKLYDEFIVKPYFYLSEVLWKEIDLKIIDFMVDLIAKMLMFSSGKFRVMQSGNLSHSLILMVCGVAVMLVILLFLGGW